MTMTTPSQTQAVTLGYEHFFKSIYENQYRSTYANEVDFYEKHIYFVTLIMNPGMVLMHDRSGVSRDKCFYASLNDKHDREWLKAKSHEELLQYSINLGISNAKLMNAQQLISAIASRIQPNQRAVAVAKPHPLNVFEHLHAKLAEVCIGDNYHRKREEQPFAIAWVDFEGTRQGGGVDPLTSSWPHIHAVMFVRREHQDRCEAEMTRLNELFRRPNTLTGDIKAARSLEFSRYNRNDGTLSDLIGYSSKGADKVPAQLVRKGNQWREGEHGGIGSLCEIFPRQLKSLSLTGQTPCKLDNEKYRAPLGCAAAEAKLFSDATAHVTSPDADSIQFEQEPVEPLTNQNDRSPRPRQTINYLPSHLRGLPQNRFGGHKTNRMRGFPGWSRGAAGPVKRYTEEERKSLELSMRQQGAI